MSAHFRASVPPAQVTDQRSSGQYSSVAWRVCKSMAGGLNLLKLAVSFSRRETEVSET